MTTDPFARLWTRNRGLFLGFEQTAAAERLDGKPFFAVTNQHWWLTGPSGSGKTRRIIFNVARLLKSWTIVFVDIKGDLHAGTAAARRDLGCEEILIDPFGVSGQGVGHNPAGALALDDNLIDETAALAAVVAPVESQREPHFDVAAQDLGQVILLHDRVTKGAKASLLSISDVVGRENAAIADWAVKASIEGIHARWPEISRKAAAWTDFGARENREREGVLASLRNKIRWLESRPVAKDLQGATTDWSVLRDRPMSVYLTLPANRLAQHSSWLKVILHSMMQRLLADASPPKVPILFVLDEASYLAGIPSIENNMALMRGYGIKLLSIYQDEPQARIALHDARSGGSRLDSYLGNAGIIMGFAPQEFNTARLLAEFGGKRTGLSYGLAADHSPWTNDMGQLTATQLQVDAVLPQQIIDLPEGYAVAFVRGRRGPITLYCPDPSEVPDLARRVGADA